MADPLKTRLAGALVFAGLFGVMLGETGRTGEQGRAQTQVVAAAAVHQTAERVRFARP